MANKAGYKKVRLVYRVDRRGNVCSYIHLERNQKDRITKIFDYVLKVNRQVTVHELHKKLKISKTSLQRLADKLAGGLWIDVQNDGSKYERVCKCLVDVQKGQFNKKANLPKTPPFLKDKAPYIFCPSTQ